MKSKIYDLLHFKKNPVRLLFCIVCVIGVLMGCSNAVEKADNPLAAEGNTETLESVQTDDGKNAFAVFQRESVLKNSPKALKVAKRNKNQTFAWIDLDGDGMAEEIILTFEEDRLSSSDFEYSGKCTLSCGMFQEEQYVSSLENEIWAISPDGQKIFIATYQYGPSGDPCTQFYCYQNGEFMESGVVYDELENFKVIDGEFFASERMYIIQTDSIIRKYQFTESGKVEEIPQETYDFSNVSDVELLQELTLYTSPNSEQTFVIQPQMVHLIKTDANFQWIYLEAEDGKSGWFEVEDYKIYGEMDGREVFYGLSFAG